MSDEEQVEPNATADESEDSGGGVATDANEENSNRESVPEFQDLDPQNVPAPGKFELSRFGGVQVVLTAELGRTKLTIQELMGLSEGSVLELDRAISAPVELVAQGVPLGNGEVVVIDDRFAIRIKQIYQS